MAVTNFHKTSFTNAKAEDLPRLLNMLVGNLDDSITPLTTSALATCVLIKDVQLKAGEVNYVAHGLSSKPNGFVIAKTYDFVMVRLSRSTNEFPELLINLESTMDSTVDIIFF